MPWRTGTFGKGGKQRNGDCMNRVKGEAEVVSYNFCNIHANSGFIFKFFSDL